MHVFFDKSSQSDRRPRNAPRLFFLIAGQLDMQGREPIVIRREKLLEAAVCCDGIDLRDTQAVADQRRILRAADIGKGKPLIFFRVSR